MTGRDQSAALRWTCPECRTRLRSEALSRDVAQECLHQLVREHLALHVSQPNAEAAASWLAPAGHRVPLWGGPHDGDSVWCPAGELPQVIVVHRTAQGHLVPLRGAAAWALPHGDVYVSDELEPVAPGGPRYVWTPR